MSDWNKNGNSSKKLTFHYIDNEELVKIFGFCHSDIDVSFNIHVCAYSFDFCYIEGKHSKKEDNMDIDDTYTTYNTYYPYIKYILQKKEDGLFSFPSFVYRCPVINTLHEENNESTEESYLDKSPEQNHFETEVFQFLLSMMQDENDIHSHSKNISVDLIYKGYIEHTKTDLYVFYDISPWKTPLKPEYSECIMDELLYKKKIMNTSINPAVTDFFKKHFELTTIRTENGLHLPHPHQLYLCSYKDKTIENINKNKTDMENANANTINTTSVLSMFRGGEKEEDDERKPIESNGDVSIQIEESPTSVEKETSIFSSYSFQNQKEIVDSLTEALIPIEHEVVGPCYLFTSELIHENDKVDRIPVFIVNCYYTHGMLNEMTEEDKVDLRKQLLKSTSVYFHENNIQLWGVRNISHIGNGLQTSV